MALPPEGKSGSALVGSTLQRFLNAALSAVGQPYRWGGAGLNWGVDCSGLVNAALLHAGYRPPRTANMLQKWTLKIAANQARAGDLVYWNKAGSTDRVPGADHVGIYLGNGMVLEASSGQKKVVIRKLWGNYEFGRVYKDKKTPINQKLGNSGITMQTLAAGGTIKGAPPPAQGGSEGSTNPTNPAVMGPIETKLSATASEREIIDFINENYGQAARAFLLIPELRNALVKAAKAGAVGDRGLEYVYQTKWWKSRTEAQRTWDILEKSNPKEAADRIAKRKAALAPLWETYGIDENINTVAKDFERLALNDAQLNLRMAKSLQTEADRRGLDKGSKGALEADDLVRIARMEYMTPVDRQTAERWAIKAIRTGEDMEAGWRSYMASIAGPRFDIDPSSGIAPGDVMAPIKSVVADNLEVNPDTIDLLDPAYAALLQQETDKGGVRPMTVAEATRWARSQEAFKGTKVAEEATSNLAEALGKAFGKVG